MMEGRQTLGNIDEISKMLGVLEGAANETRHQLKALFDHREKQDAMLQQIASKQTAILATLNALKPHVNDYRRFKRWVMLVAATVGLGSGIGATGAMDWLRSVLPFLK